MKRVTEYMVMICGLIRMALSDLRTKIGFDPPAENIPEDTNIDGVA